MGSFQHIQHKLQKFIRKYYVNELIKGLFLFFTLGFLYFIFTLLVEHFLWLKPTFRTILFWLFILVEIILLANYIITPIFKIYGLKKGITEFEASKIIGNHFPEVNDKLLNMLQLKNIQQNSELIIASIEQKSKELQRIPFKKAVDFSKNKKYIKYAFIPIVIWLFTVITGNISIFNDSLTRVVHHKATYQPPAPFSFKILNENLNVIEGQPFILQVETIGNTIPEDVKINFDTQSYYLQNKGLGKFEYQFTNIKKPIDFYVEANGVVSNTFHINLIATPVITNLALQLKYPSYTGKKNEILQNTGNAIVPQGTEITWKINTNQTTDVSFISENDNIEKFIQNEQNQFNLSKKIVKNTAYKITTSNAQLTNYESLNFQIQVVTDEFPKISVQSDIDSISRGPAQFIGQISDDYGIKKLQLVYYNKNTKNDVKKYLIEVSKNTFSDFYYIFPEGIQIDEGVEYELYFEVFDNDFVNGSKKTKSRTFSYYNKTEGELKEELLKEQQDAINAISKGIEKSKLTNQTLEKFNKELQKKADINWNDTKKLEEFIKRQSQYQQMFKKQTNQLQNNLLEQPESDKLKDKKSELQQRIEETKKLAEQEKLLDELKELSEKLQKDDLVHKLKELTKKNKQNEQSLERILELTKRFYVEQKANQISEKLDDLAKKQDSLATKNDNENSSEKQDEINKEFENIKNDFKELNKENKLLKRPMKFPESDEETNKIDEELNKALDELNSKNQNNAKQHQKAASKKMKQLSKSMEQSMEANDSEMIDENIDDLRKIVENLIEFSFQQEELFNKFSVSNNASATYASNLKKQHTLKEYFEHIDDSLYTLSLRLVRMSSRIQQEVSNVHYNIDESLSNLTENKIDQGVSNQQFVITGANNLANSLSNLLESLMNASPSLGKGGKNSKQFTLPDIIKKQGELMQQMKEGIKKQQMNGTRNEDTNGELFEIYKQQAQLRELLKKILGNSAKQNSGSGKAEKQMEELEKELLEKGFSNKVIDKMKQLNYELLKLEKAKKEQGKDTKRESKTNIQIFESKPIDKLKLSNEYFNYNEILNRQSLPLRTIYQKKVQEYFKSD